MVVYAEFEISADRFRIGRAFSHFPGVQVRLDRIVPIGDAVVPFIWVRNADPHDVVQQAMAEEAVEQITVLHEEPGGETLFRVVWNRRFRDTVVAIDEADIALLSGTGTETRWRFEFRAVERSSLATFQRDLDELGIPVTVLRLHERDTKGEATRLLTDAQVEALRLAHERGYFSEPRESDLETLARELGISRQAFAGRIRRGMDNLLTSAFPEADR